MCHFHNVTVPLSMTESDIGLIRYAHMVASLGVTNEVRFVHVVTPTNSEAARATRNDVLLQMKALVAEHFGEPIEEVAVDCHVVEGNRIDQLVDFSIHFKADLILLGHRNARSGRRSLAQRLAMITPCSVWSVPEDSPPRLNRILAPIDFSDHSADSLAMATCIARLQGLDTCETIHAFFDPSAIRYDERVDEIRGEEQLAFEKFVADVNTHGVTVQPTFVECNQTADAVIRHGVKMRADLIVMSTRGRSQTAAILLGSVTAQTIAESPMPVLAVKHFGAHLNLLEALRASRFWARPNAQTN